MPSDAETKPKTEFDPAHAPLAGFGGERPPAPEWFDKALAQTPERRMIEAGEGRIETLIWGPAGAPGLMFLHGNGAHADWWSFVAPYFAEDRRVVAMSLAGMGGSDWLPAYSTYSFVEQIEAVATQTGLLGGAHQPVIVGHSMGAALALAAAGSFGKWLKAVVLADPPFQTPERSKAWRERREKQPPRTFPKRYYKSLPEALGRFRFLPPQPSEHPYIVDHIARGSLQESEGGWSWRFDPQLWSKMTFSDLSDVLKDPGCPIAFVHGERSKLHDAEDLAYMWAAAPKGSPVVIVPDAEHHLMVDQPLAFIAALRGLLAGWPT